MRAQLTFRSGAQVVVDVDRLSVTHDGPSGQISRIQWNNATFGSRLLGIVPADVVAVVELDAQPTEWPKASHRYLKRPGVPIVEHPPHPGQTCDEYDP